MTHRIPARAGCRAALLCCAVLAAAAAHAENADQVANADKVEIAPGALEERIVAVAKKIQPLVVHIEAIVRVNDRRNQVTGSGFVASPDGLVLTNQHVVENAQKVEVSVPGRRQPYRAKVLGSDRQTDIAVLRIEPDAPLPIAEFVETADVRVGQWVLAIGNPYGLEGTVSLGIVSAKGRNLEIPGLLNDFIQTDAMIDRGSSGGPLVDLDGRVIGINSRGQGRGIGFTIPADIVRVVMEQITSGGVERGWLGIAMQPLDRDLAAYLGIAGATGVVVNGVSDGSPAARAGLREGDVITGLDDANVEAEEEEDLGRFQRLVAGLPPGTRVRLATLRGGEERGLTITLGEQPTVDPEEAESDLGFHVQEITEALHRQERLGTREGAYVSFVARGSPAAEAGLVPGDVIVGVDDALVTDIPAFESAIERVEAQDRVLLRARRGPDLRFVLVERPPTDDASPPEAALPAGDDAAADETGLGER